MKRVLNFTKRIIKSYFYNFAQVYQPILNTGINPFM
jgi:hypothetical protein